MARSVHLVSEVDAAWARKIEERILRIPRDAGILFVGVKVIPSEEHSIFWIWIGCDRQFDERLYPELIRVQLKDWIEDGLHLEISAHRGCVHPLIEAGRNPAS